MKTIIKALALLALFAQISMMNIQLRKKAMAPEADAKDKEVHNDTSLIKKEEEKKPEVALNETVKSDVKVKNITTTELHRIDGMDDDDKNDIDYYDDQDDEGYDDKDEQDTSKLDAFDEEKFKKEVDDIKKKAKLDKNGTPTPLSPSVPKTKPEATTNTTLPAEGEKKEIVH